MNKLDFNKIMIERLSGFEEKPRLLLHSCCAPCSSHCLSVLAPLAKVSVLYFNPNIYPREEYEKRKSEQKRLIESAFPEAELLDADYDHDAFLRAAAGLEGEREGGARCEKCFRLRLERAAREAKAGGFDLFATTLTVSPHKNAPLINAIGLEEGEKAGVEFLPSDFKKRDGYLHSVRLSEKYALYRQNYCGCEFSLDIDNKRL